MKRQLFFFLSVLLNISFAVAQSVSPITITHDRSTKGDYTLWVENTSFTPYTVTVYFDKMSNTTTVSNGDSKDIFMGHGKRSLIILRPTFEGRAIGFSFRTHIQKGNMRAKVDTNYVYLIPLAVGKPASIRRLVSMETLLKQSAKSQRVVGVAFKTNEGDTIMAARGGLVTDVQDNSASITENKSFNATENYVEIYHNDGSFARYKLFQDGGIFVLPGDEVIPGQPIGVIGGSNYKGGSHLRFTLYCPSPEYCSFSPTFYLGGGKTGKPIEKEHYVSEHPQGIIMQEMSKKEQKKYLAK